MLNTKEVDRLSIRYICQSAMIIAASCIATVAAGRILSVEGLKGPLVVSAVFSLIIDGADGMIWKKVAKGSPESLTTFYTAVSGFRMLLALATLFGVYLAVGRDAMVEYCIVFMAFYFVLLIHHSVFFSRVSNSHTKCDRDKAS